MLKSTWFSELHLGSKLGSDTCVTRLVTQVNLLFTIFNYLLKVNCFTILYWFLPYNNANIYIYISSTLPLEPASPLLFHSSRSSQSARLGSLCYTAASIYFFNNKVRNNNTYIIVDLKIKEKAGTHSIVSIICCKQKSSNTPPGYPCCCQIMTHGFWKPLSFQKSKP